MVTRRDSIVFAQVPLLRSQLDELKRRSGTTTTKDALQTAVTHYLRCPTMRKAPASGDKGTKRGARTGMSERVNEEDWWWSPEERAEL